MDYEQKKPDDAEKRPVITRREALERMAKLGFVIAIPSLIIANCSGGGGGGSSGYSSTIGYLSGGTYTSGTYSSAYTSGYSSQYCSVYHSGYYSQYCAYNAYYNYGSCYYYYRSYGSSYCYSS